MFAVVVRMELLAWSQLRRPGVPGLVGLGQRARPIATDQQAKVVAFLDWIVPAFRPDRHVEFPSGDARNLHEFVKHAGPGLALATRSDFTRSAREAPRQSLIKCIIRL